MVVSPQGQMLAPGSMGWSFCVTYYERLLEIPSHIPSFPNSNREKEIPSEVLEDKVLFCFKRRSGKPSGEIFDERLEELSFDIHTIEMANYAIENKWEIDVYVKQIVIVASVAASDGVYEEVDEGGKDTASDQ
ncbi:hypothetical protein VNO77_33405 [Canavalia gladiata]|uniref:Uncharacterized protein n=1 Tax=Canavalia gladiata TaxID=3824 RepID=A0AAN9KCC7_CANGL